jgi:hypothetical protein
VLQQFLHQGLLIGIGQHGGDQHAQVTGSMRIGKVCASADLAPDHLRRGHRGRLEAPAQGLQQLPLAAGTGQAGQQRQHCNHHYDVTPAHSCSIGSCPPTASSSVDGPRR